MLEQKQIAEVVTAILKSNFSGFKVYADEVQEGFARPAFFIELILITTTETVNFNSNQLSIIITYMSREKTDLDNKSVYDRIRKAFGMVLPVGNRKLKIKEISFDKTGENKEILQVTISIDYFDTTDKQTEQHELMKELHYSERVNKCGLAEYCNKI